MWKVILPFIIIFALILVGPLLPKTNCSVDWLDSRLQRSDGPFLQCPKQLDERRIGLANFSRIGADVYRVTRSEYTEPAGFPCMIGAACLPIPIGRRTWKKIEFIRLDGPVVFERLQPYMDGNYMSDGDALFTDYKRVDSTQAPIDPTRLRSLPCVPYDTGAPCGAYSTDGRYVLEGEQWFTALTRQASPTISQHWSRRVIICNRHLSRAIAHRCSRMENGSTEQILQRSVC